MKPLLIKLLRFVRLYRSFSVPASITKNFINLNESDTDKLNNLISGFCKPEGYDSAENRILDINALAHGRLNKFRSTHIPFLIELVGLKGKEILEIGCGTGSSTLALSEQGASVTGIDIDTSALDVARQRLKLFGIESNFQCLNAQDIKKHYSNKKWDIIIFYASLEHMTPKERKQSLSAASEILNPDGYLCIFGSPNRLWPYDLHTSQLSFYMWLQDELAVDYARFSDRTEFSKIHKMKYNNASYESLYRWGRGVSFHEIEVALGGISKIEVIGSLPIYLRRYSLIQKISYMLSDEYKYKSILAKYGPKNIHHGFYECYMDVIIRLAN